MTNLCKEFVSHIQRLRLFTPNDKLLLAISGGVDSIVLAALCAEAGFSFEIAHVNFRLRGNESDEDEQLVRSLAEKYGTRIHVQHFDTENYARDHRVSIQLAARQLRYEWFEKIISEGGADGPKLLMTAHHRDDNIETTVFNFFRGTGIRGMRGMPDRQNNVVRPLLVFSKQQLIDYAVQLSLKWREDDSNRSGKYSRNYIRNELLPQIRTIIPEAENNVSANIDRFKEVEQLYDQAVEGYRKKLLKRAGKEFQISIGALKLVQPLHSILYELIHPFGFSASQIGDVIKLIDATQASFVLSAGHRIIKNRKWLIIAAKQVEEADLVMIERDDKKVAIPQPFNSLKQHSKNKDEVVLDSALTTAFMDSRELEYPLLVRKWKPGDYFYPLGMRKKKKISRFLIDLKLSPPDKEKVFVLQSGKKICWLIGFRIDDRFKVKDNTKTITVFEVDQLAK